jgi:hypothetical protein
MTYIAFALLCACTRPGLNSDKRALDAGGTETAAGTDTSTDTATSADTSADTATHSDTADSGCVDAPIADAGPDQTVTRGAVVELEGAGLSGCGPYQFYWTLQAVPSGSSTGTQLQDVHAANPTFTAYSTGRYVFSLSVSDGIQWSAPDTVTVTATD